MTESGRERTISRETEVGEKDRKRDNSGRER